MKHKYVKGGSVIRFDNQAEIDFYCRKLFKMDYKVKKFIRPYWFGHAYRCKQMQRLFKEFSLVRQSLQYVMDISKLDC